MSNFIVIAYYTKGTPYENEVKPLQSSLSELNILHEIIPVPNLGSWDANTHYKPTVIKSVLLAQEKNVLYVDADAVFLRRPNLIPMLRCDVAYHRLRMGSRPDELLSGTLFFANNDRALDLIEKWEWLCKQDTNSWDQQILQHIIDDRQIPDLIVDELPYQYCRIFDLDQPQSGPTVIEHHQASRRLKFEVRGAVK